MVWEINFGILKKCKEVGHCVCDLGKPCPCESFLGDAHVCRCGAYKEVK